jgi:hypothetical protein
MNSTKMIDTTEVNVLMKYEIEELKYKNICPSATVIEGTYKCPENISDEEAKNEISSVLEGTFGGYWTKFANNSFIYKSCSE